MNDGSMIVDYRPCKLTNMVFMVAIFIALPTAIGQNFDDTVAGEIDQRTMALLEVNDYINHAEEYANGGNTARAYSNYRKAFESLPFGDAAKGFRSRAEQGYAKAAVTYAEELMERNRGREAKLIIDELLSDDRIPNDNAALVLSRRLKDPEWNNSAATPKHMEKVSEVGRLLAQAKAANGMGEYDKATSLYSEVINLDPYNTAAQRGLATTAKRTTSYYDAAYDQTRAEFLDRISEKWTSNDPDAKVSASMSPSETLELGDLENAPQSADIARKLAEITIPEVNFNNMTIEPAMRYLEKISRDNDFIEPDPNRRGVNFVLSSSPAIDRARGLSLRAKSIPLVELVRYVTEFVGAKFRVDQYAVQIIPLDDDDATMVSRSYLVRPDFFTAGPLDSSAGAGADEDPFGDGGGVQIQAISPKEFLMQSGVSFPEGSSAQYLPTSNRLLVNNTYSNLEIIDSLVQTSIDDGPKQVAIKVTVMDVQQENLEELGFDWLLGGFDLEESKGLIFGGGTTVTGDEFGSDFTFNDPETGEIFGGQRVTSSLRSGEGAIGVDGLDRVIGIDRETALSTSLAPGVFGLQGALSDPQFQAVMRGLNQKKSTDLVTAPMVTVKAGFQAKIESGIELTYPVEYDPPELPQEVTVTNGGGVFPVTPSHPTTFETRPLGFNLVVEPAISPDGSLIDLNLKPEFVEFQGFVNYGSAITAAGTDPLGNATTTLVTDNQILMPVFATIREQVNVSIYDGATIVIGGLTESSVDTITDKVPIIGDLPFVGRLFRSNIDRTQSRAVVIFVTAKVIDSRGARLDRSVGVPNDDFDLSAP